VEFVEFALPEKILNVDMPFEEIVVVPVGDVHFGAKGFAERSFLEFLNTIEREFKDSQVYYLGMGDYVDAYRATVRKAFKHLAVDDGDAIDEFMYDKLDQFYSMVQHTKGQWLGMLKGNHTWEFRAGTTFESGRKYPVGKLIDDICPHFPDSDIFLMGHVHLREYRDFIRMRRVGRQYVDQNGVAAITGGWLKGYIEGPSTYVERKALKPRAVGGLVVKVRPRMVHGIFAPRIRVETL
jgi:hypothetical protein